MRFLTKDKVKKHDFFTMKSWFMHEKEGKIPLVFLDGNGSASDSSDLIEIHAPNLGLSKKEEELKLILIPDTFDYFPDYDEKAYEPWERSVRADFQSQYINRLRIISMLPDEIRARIKDKRLLALGYADHDLREELLRFADTMQQNDDEAWQQYEWELKKVVSKLTLCDQLYEYDCDDIHDLLSETVITRKFNIGDNLYIELRDEVVLILSNAKVVEEEINPTNSFPYFYELHERNGKYELHLLLTKVDENLIEHYHYATYSFDDMSLQKRK